MWNGNGERILWQINSEWSDRGEHYGFRYQEDAIRVLSRDIILVERTRCGVAQYRLYIIISGNNDKTIASTVVENIVTGFVGSGSFVKSGLIGNFHAVSLP